MNYKFLKSHKFLENLFIKFWTRSQGGQFLSHSLRTYYKSAYNIDAGLYTYGWLAPSFNFGGGAITIGKYCSIASGVIRLGANHPINSISTHPYFYNPALGFEVQDVPRSKLQIGHGVWIGYNSLILPSCTCIGNGAVIGAGSILTHDVAPYEIVAGNPAKKIRMRFDPDTVQMLENSTWWNYTPEELMIYKDYFSDIPSFYKAFCSDKGAL